LFSGAPCGVDYFSVYDVDYFSVYDKDEKVSVHPRAA
jgi:hypothetical protein